MRWSWRLVTVAGIGVYVHATYLLLLIGAGWYGYSQEKRWLDALVAVLFVITLFALVVMHEFGHALMARRYGISTRDITLLPIGGVARLERMPEKPRQELAVALAGPAVNVLLAGLLFAVLGAVDKAFGEEFSLGTGGGVITDLMLMNIMLAVFNLVPAFPMDGGRVLRALLAIRMDYARATNIAARVGQGMAGVFAIFGLFSANPLLFLIALFVWMGAAQEARMVQMKSALGRVTVADVMMTDFRTLEPEDTLSQATMYLLAGWQKDFPVVSDGRLEGMLPRRVLMEGLARLGAGMPVADVMERDVSPLRPEDLLDGVLLSSDGPHARSIPVVKDGRLVGLLTAENVREFLMVRSALERRGARANAPGLATRTA
ncbi:MAG TPA: site-2 protease family protein [Verrucomicrobia bacterium]|nr:site-2 protease family protein [Verrucomicrobiota bacterium]HOP98408.1 site-2 protease family protein [Verrucomicrobiota bacterium]